MEKQFIQIQLGLFFKSDFNVEIENISLAIKKQFGHEITTQILGIPNNAAPEIPRLVVNSELVNINLAKNRIDFFSKKENFVQENFEKIFSIIESLAVEIGRVGVVVTQFKEISIDELKKIFDEEKIASLRPKEIMMRFNEDVDINGFMSNNSQMYTTGFIKDMSGVQKNGVVLTRDINTLIEKVNQYSFTKEVLNSFIVSAISIADTSII